MLDLYNISDVKHLTENVNLTSSEIFNFDVFDFQQRQNDVSITYYTRYCTNFKLIVNSCFSSRLPI